ncbi:hypothetical protein M758_10G174600 [Ceratodon purpureus]|nr:hypothetical protein M758_10G174600 [Ceratodon purpureus]
MRRAGQLVYSALFGRAGTEEPVPTESTTSSSHSYSVSSLSSGGSLEAEEVEDHYGSAESNSRGSSSYSDFRASDSDADGRGRRAPREGEGSTGSAHSRVVADARNLASELGSETAVIDDGHSPPHHGQSSTWSRRGFEGRGASRSRAISSKKLPTRSGGLKEVQLEKLQRLEALDRAWDELYPNEREEQFEWPWEALTEQQVALGKLDFRKFIVLLSGLSKTGLEPENALSLEQINTLQQVPLEDVPEYIAREVAIRHKIPDEFFSDVKDIKRTWLEKDGPVSFECHVDNNDVCRFKIVEQRPTSTVLHRTFGGDRVMLVFFNIRPRNVKRFQKGIVVGLRRYRLWTFKDTGKDEFKDRGEPTEEEYRRAVRGYFVCTESLADIDLNDPNFKYITRIHAARCHIMNIHNVPTMSDYCNRLQLALSLSTPVALTIPELEFVPIDDLVSETFDNIKNKPLSFTDGAGEMSLAVAKLLGSNHVVRGRKTVNKEEYPSLIQHRTYKSGMALKGTYQVNHQLEGLKIRYRPSMRKVDDKNRLVLPIIDDTLEILNTSRKPREASLCQDLIILLSLGGVPADFFEQLVQNALEKIKNVFTDWDLAYEEVQNSDPEYDTYRDETFRMLEAGFPMNHPHLQRNLRYHMADKLKSLSRGCVPLKHSFYLMGTSDPTPERILKPNQVAIAMESGKKIWGKVLVYKNPGKHWGDIHVFDAIWNKEFDKYVGQAGHTIFFSTQGDRPIVDEIAKADLDGDLFWICSNTELISQFTASKPWERPSAGSGLMKKVQLTPSKLSPEARENIMFNKFLKACVESASASPLKLAATYWKSHMDRLLIMKDEVRTHGTVHEDQDSVYQKLEQLINLFYRAVDAEKNDDEVWIPEDLIPEKRPHHMRKAYHKDDNFYTSPSVLGRLFDLTNISIDSLGCAWEDTLEYDPNFEHGEFRKHLGDWKVMLKRYNEEIRSKKTKEERDVVLHTYQQIYMFSSHDKFEEASAIYYANYEHIRERFTGKFQPSLYFAMQIAGPQLYRIYAENLSKGIEPYVIAYPVRRRMLISRR